MTDAQATLIKTAIDKGYSLATALQQAGYRGSVEAARRILLDRAREEAIRSGAGQGVEKAARAVEKMLEEAAQRSPWDDFKRSLAEEATKKGEKFKEGARNARRKVAEATKRAVEAGKNMLRRGLSRGIDPSRFRFMGQTFLGLSAPAWLAVAAGLGVLGIGGYIYSQGEAPLVATQKGTPDGRGYAVDDVPTGLQSSEPYGVFVGGPYNEVLVGQKTVIENLPSSSLIGWGRDPSKSVKETGATLLRVLGPFDTLDGAVAAYRANMVPDSERIKPFASGTCARFTFDGQEHDIDNALRVH